MEIQCACLYFFPFLLKYRAIIHHDRCFGCVYQYPAFRGSDGGDYVARERRGVLTVVKGRGEGVEAGIYGGGVRKKDRLKSVVCGAKYRTRYIQRVVSSLEW